MLVYDQEIFKHDSLLGVLNIETNEITQLWDIEKIKKFTKDNLNEIFDNKPKFIYKVEFLRGGF